MIDNAYTNGLLPAGDRIVLNDADVINAWQRG